MKGYLLSPKAGPLTSDGQLQRWESLVVDAVGSAIEFWGFKQNHGRAWALLYLRDQPLTALEIQRALGLSKGAVSMVTRELEQWGVVHRVRGSAESTWRFQAETDLMRMIGRVISEREARFVERIEWDLEQALTLAKQAHAPRAALARIERMRVLAKLTRKAVTAFLATARLDVRALANILRGKEPR